MAAVPFPFRQAVLCCKKTYLSDKYRLVPLSRRSFALSLAAATARGQSSLIRRYFDPATEAEVLVLSDPAQATFLTHPANRCAAARNAFIVYATESAQGFQAVRLELKGGVARTLTSASALDPRSVILSPDDRTVYYADGDQFFSTPSTAGRPKEIFRASSPAAFRHGLSLSEDGTSLVLMDQGKLLQVPLNSPKPSPRTLAEPGPSASAPIVSKGGNILFRDEAKAFHLVTPSQPKPRRLPIEGDLGPAVWNPDGRSFVFLRVNQGRGIANSLHDYSLDTTRETLTGRTSQFVHFNRNTDSSVFVGASGSKAQPFILVMLRITRRELALCEHKASDPTTVAPRFAPSSQRIFFQSDRLGKPAIFSMAVEKIVERTEAEEASGKKS
jgi:oligogalacturonide lyase